MPETENIGSFLKENKKLVKEYLDIRLEVYKLSLTRIFSKSAGYFIWIIISLFLFFLFIIFLGIVTGLWLSDLTGSYIKGFGLTAIIIFAVIIILTLLRNVLFVNPAIRSIISRIHEETGNEK